MDVSRCVVLVLWLMVSVECYVQKRESGDGDKIADEEAARAWLDQYNQDATDMFYNSSVIWWNYETNITDYNQNLTLETYLESSNFNKKKSEEANHFAWRNFTDVSLRRQFRFLTKRGIDGIKDENLLKEIVELQSDMEKIYSTGKVCYKSSDNCLTLEPDLTRVLANSRDYLELLQAWKGWRDATGRKMKDGFEQFVNLSNHAIRSLGDFDNYADYWLSWYDSATFEEEVIAIMEQLKPLYMELHTYVREKLQDIYPDHKFPATGHIPAHLLGNMWAQSWDNLYDIMQPFKNKTGIDVTRAMVSQNYTVDKMFKDSEEFFISLGFPKLRKSFWENSMLERPNDREVSCHGSAWDFYKYYDYRIKMCTDITQDDLYTVHHEMGHTYYQMAYENQSVPFRDGANPAFHEAIGDTIALSVVTPDHLHKIGLLDTVENDLESDINFLMNVALDKIAFLPFAFALDSWRWDVFRGKTPPQQYNSKWWELRCKYQGISPPVERSEEDFDPGAKYHVPFQVSYIRYFAAFILQFQFQKALCDVAGHQGPLYRCDIYNSTTAGDKLREMLSLGSSKTWPDALESMTGQRNMDASAFIEYFQPLTDWLKIQNKGKRVGWTDSACPSPTSGLIDNEEAGWEWIEQNDNRFITVHTEMAVAEWQYATNITDHNSKLKVESNVKFAEYQREAVLNASVFDWTNFQNETLRRLFKYINSTIGINSLEDKGKLEKYNSVISEMEAITSKANVCLSDGLCHQLTPGLTEVFAESRNYSLLAEAWEKWRDVTGCKMKALYEEMVNISNEAFAQLGYEDTGAYWRSWYESPTFQDQLKSLITKLEPLYKNLHAYIRRKLRQFYGEEHFPASGHIPAHLLGNMWGQQWNNIYDLVEPFKDKQSIDITPKLKELKLNAFNLFKVAEEFFTSLGLMEMPQSFWNDSMFVKPDDRDVICHASAWDFHNGKDFRIKMCTKVDTEDLMTIHHEMGHIQYFLQYKDRPIPFRKGANNGFHEAVGDVMELSVSTPEHLHKIGFLDNLVHDTESDINFLMSMALKKIAFLPFGYLVDLWRWSVFSGETTPENYNEKWWQLRCRLQGMSPPISRTADDFDPGAKYHIASNDAYIRYFVSFVLQFQFHKALCIAAGKTGPLHHCDIYQSREAGKLLRDMLELGASQPWQDALEKITGQREIDAEPLMEYFKPLTDWLIEQNQNDTVGWLKECPQEKPDLIDDVEAAKEWLLDFDEEMQKMDWYYVSALWKLQYQHDGLQPAETVNGLIITLTEASLVASDFSRRAAINGSRFNWKHFSDPVIKKQFSLIVDQGTSLKDAVKTEERSNVMANLQSTYSKAKACLTKDRCLTMEPDLKILMSTSRNQTELLQAWRSWRDATGRKMKKQYARFVELSNEGARQNGYSDTGEYWRSWYETPSLRDDLVKLLDQLQVLYLQLHTYVKGRLKEFYGSENFPRSGHIPSHLLGNMWAQNWMNIYDIVQPFKDKAVPDVTKTMKEKNITVIQMFKLSEEFFVSLNLSAMPSSFWENSMLERPPDGRDVVCHASAWDFGNGKDFRIKMCTNVSVDTFQVIHHEMGHIQYYLQYKDQPSVFRRGANPGFHEAVGDVVAMSVLTPVHLHKLGLLETVENDFESDINFLMSMALEKIAFLPFGYLIDQWRWSVFSGETTPDEYNEKWWQLRCKYQGVSPPIERSEEDFDPGSKYHVPGNTPYIRYFISHVIEFQFHKALCDAAGHTGPLHKCDIYQSKEAGKLLGDMLKLGSSEPWQVAMEAITGQRSMSVEPIIDYFQPLIDWLSVQNEGKQFGWMEKCQQPRSNLIKDEELAKLWLADYNKQAEPRHQRVSELEWNFLHQIGSSPVKLDMEEAQEDLAEFNNEVWLNASRFDWENFVDKDLQHEFRYVRQDVDTDVLTDPKKRGKLRTLINDFKEMEIDDDLKNSLATYRNYSHLKNLWHSGQRVESGILKDKYAEIVGLRNEAANELGFIDTGEVWRSRYEGMASKQDLEGLWEQVKPLYQELHCYVRKRLRTLYGTERFPVSGQIPSHILGNLMGDNWENIYDVLVPFKDKADVSITPVLNARNYTTEMMFRKADEFFRSIGLPNLPASFWERSMFKFPSKNCNVSPKFVNLGSNDIRLHICTDIDQDSFVSIHKELARIQYSWAYQRQPFNMQTPANPGFEEAVAGLVGLSVSTSKHFNDIGLLEKAADDTEETFNFLMKNGLQTIPSLPFGHLIGLWQASAFSGETYPEKYNEHWWKLRNKYQGLSLPEDEIRDEVFYPGTGDHGSVPMPYIRYFVGTLLAFQLHEGLCIAAGNDGPLHKCDIYQSRQAGALLTQMLESGRSINWQDILEQMTGQRRIAATSFLKYFKPLYDWLKEQNKGESTGWNDDYSPLTIEERANELVNSFNKEAVDVYRNETLARWNYEVNINADTEESMITSMMNAADFAKNSAEEVSTIPWKKLKDRDTRRQLKAITDIGANAMANRAKLKRLYNVQSRIQSMHRKAKVCLSPNRCLTIMPGLTGVMATSRNQTVLLNAWKGWREATRNTKPYYNEFVDLSNEASRDIGYSHTGEYLRAKYELPQIESDLEGFLKYLNPFYENLHAYVRKRLGNVYGIGNFPSTGHIPAHLLGDVWGQSWGNIYDLVVPYNGSQSTAITPELKRQKYTVKKLFKTAEDFFVSLGLSPLPVSFWNNSMFEKPVGRDVECQTSAWDMFNQSDVRIKMCGTVDMENLLTIHQEVGNMQYFMQDRNQPVIFRRGAIPGFLEAVGGVVTLSVSTSSHLGEIGLLNTSSRRDDLKADINFLMKMALDRIAFLPFSYFINQWWWSVFKGETTPEYYNEKWWQLRCKYQGVFPPVERTEKNFDPGAIYQSPASNEITRYFVSSVVQFQFHKALCDAAGHTGPLHKCDIYHSKEAGKLLSDMLKLGSSVPWPEALKVLTGQNNMDVGPLLEYFEPLIDWLQKENYRERPGWSDACPTEKGRSLEVPSSDSSGTSRKNISFVFLLHVAILCQLLLVIDKHSACSMDMHIVVYATCPLLFISCIYRCIVMFTVQHHKMTDTVNMIWMYFATLLFVRYCSASLIDSEPEGRQFMSNFGTEASSELSAKVSAKWKYVTNVTNINGRASSDVSKEYLEFQNTKKEEAEKYNWKSFTDGALRRQFKILEWIPKRDTTSIQREVVLTVAQMMRIYHSANMCQGSGKCIQYSPLMDGHEQVDRDEGNLLKLWKEWREVTGRLLRPKYIEYVDFMNRFSKFNGYSDGAEYWNRKYESTTFENDMHKILLQLQPLYKQLHTFIRRKLIARYGGNSFQSSGQIPAHLVGNLWGGNWDNMYDLVKPYPKANIINVTQVLRQRGYTVNDLVEMAQTFYTSLGFEQMTTDFWAESIFTKPKDREMECEPVAFDFSNKQDFRIKMCGVVTEEDVLTIHIQMGHTVYQMSYKNQPFLFRAGANPAFVDAAAGLSKLSFLTQEHFKSLGFIPHISNDNELDINDMMRLALEHVAPLPFYYIVDKWRWDVFQGRTPSNTFNRDWWKLRCQYQGVSPPVKRTEEDLDIASAYQIAGNKPYIKNFVSTILKFQWQKALCGMGQQQDKPLHKCDITGLTQSGRKLKEMLELGASRPWPEAMQVLTGTQTMSATPLLEYFQPLMEWLTNQNSGHKVGWDIECPKFETAGNTPDSASEITPAPLCSVLTVAFILIHAMG
ncbi:uncharacterized protein LOC117341835 [Pecten maximus]|uniref:uncharacterized protein LOC117341835 n=1 Tax=Pecten maximus TaxID=6579 RepID=UPI0014581EFF|nr:uncharacterized protein LOC117341835 [Pecten maximus]